MPQKRGKELASWKEIAAFLGVAERTAQKWEKERGLPVRRLPGQRGRVAATPEDLERWLEETYQRAPWYSNLVFFRYYSALVTLLLVLGIGLATGYYLRSNRTGSPAGFRIDYRTLIVTDASGRELWRHSFPEALLASVYEKLGHTRRIWFGDLDHDGSKEVLFLYWPTTIETEGTKLICFGEKGEELWTFTPGRDVSDATRSFLNVFLTEDFAVHDLDGDGIDEILVTSHQLDSHPNQFAVLDPQGGLRSEYWNSGHLPWMSVAELDFDTRPEILLGGVNNGYRSGVLVVLDSGNISGASPQPEGDPFQLQAFSPGSQKAYLVFHRTCVNRTLEQYNFVKGVVSSPEAITVKTTELRTDPTLEVIYTLGQNLKVERVRWSDMLKDLHQKMRLQEELDHDLTDSEIEALKQIVSIRSSR